MNQTQQERRRTFTWSDPSASGSQLGRRSGLEVLQAMISGELPPPPVFNLIGMDRMEVDEGRIVVYASVQEYHYNPIGSVHGGVLATLLDTAAGCAVHSLLPAGTGYTSLDLTTKFLRPATVASGELRCEGTVISRGRSTALSQAQITDAAGKLVAHAVSTCLLFDAGQP